MPRSKRDPEVALDGGFQVVNVLNRQGLIESPGGLQSLHHRRINVDVLSYHDRDGIAGYDPRDEESQSDCSPHHKKQQEYPADQIPPKNQCSEYWQGRIKFFMRSHLVLLDIIVVIAA